MTRLSIQKLGEIPSLPVAAGAVIEMANKAPSINLGGVLCFLS